MNFGIVDLSWNILQDILKSEKTIIKVILFGSRAKGNYKSGSDIDLCIYVEELESELNTIRSLCSKVDDSLIPYKIDFIGFNSITSNDLLGHIERVGIQIYQK